MTNLVLSPIDPQILINKIAEKVTANILEAIQTKQQPKAKASPLDDFIPKTEIRGKLASSSTLWKYEKEGKLKLYGIGGKRYYKRADIEALFVEITN